MVDVAEAVYDSARSDFLKAAEQLVRTHDMYDGVAGGKDADFVSALMKVREPA